MKKTTHYELTPVESIQAQRNRDLLNFLLNEGFEVFGHQVYDKKGNDPSLILGFYRDRGSSSPLTSIEVVPSSRLEVALDSYFARKER